MSSRKKRNDVPEYLQDYCDIEGVDIEQLRRDLETDVDCLELDDGYDPADDIIEDVGEMNFNINFGIMGDKEFDEHIEMLRRQEEELLAEIAQDECAARRKSPSPRRKEPSPKPGPSRQRQPSPETMEFENYEREYGNRGDVSTIEETVEVVDTSKLNTCNPQSQGSRLQQPRQLRPPSKLRQPSQIGTCPPAVVQNPCQRTAQSGRPSGIRPPAVKQPQGYGRPSGLRPPSQKFPPEPCRPTGLRPPTQQIAQGYGRPSGLRPPAQKFSQETRPSGLRPPTQKCPPRYGSSSGPRPPTQKCPPGTGRPSGPRPPAQKGPPGYRGLRPPAKVCPPKLQSRMRPPGNVPRRKSPLISSGSRAAPDIIQEAIQSAPCEVESVIEDRPCQEVQRQSPQRVQEMRASPRKSPQQLQCEKYDEDILNVDDLQLDEYRPLSQLERVKLEVPLELRTTSKTPRTITLRMDQNKVSVESAPSIPEEYAWEQQMATAGEAVCEQPQQEQRRFIPEFQYETPPRLKRKPFSYLVDSYDGISGESIELYDSPSPEKHLLSPSGAEERRRARECYEQELFNNAEGLSDALLDEEGLDYEEIMDADEQFSYDFMSQLRQRPSRNLIREGVPLEEKRAANLARRQNRVPPRIHRRRRGKTTRRCYGQRPNVDTIKEYYEGPTEAIYDSPRRRVPPVYPSVITPPSAEKNYEALPEIIKNRINPDNQPRPYTRRPLDRRKICPRKLGFDEVDEDYIPRPISPCRPRTPSPNKNPEFQLTHTEATKQKLQRVEEQFPTIYSPSYMEEQADAYYRRRRPKDLITFKLGEYDFHISPPRPSILNEDVPQAGLARPLLPYEYGWKSPPNMPTRKPLSPRAPTVIKIMPSKYINVLDQEEFPYEDMPPKVTGWEFPYLATQAPYFVDRLGTEGNTFVSPKKSPRISDQINYEEDINLDCEELEMDDVCNFLDECEKIADNQNSPRGSPNKRSLDASQPLTIRIENGNVTVDPPQNEHRSLSPPKSPGTREFEALERELAKSDRDFDVGTEPKESTQTISITVEEKPARSIPRPTNIPRPGGYGRPTGIPKPGGVARPGVSKMPQYGGAAGTSGVKISINSTPSTSKTSCTSAMQRSTNAKGRRLPQYGKKPPGKKGKPAKCPSAREENLQETPDLEISISMEAMQDSQSEINIQSAPINNDPVQRTPPDISARRLVLQRKLFKNFDELGDLDSETAPETYCQPNTSPLSQPLNLYRFREQVRTQPRNRRCFRKKGKRMNLNRMYARPIPEEEMEGQCDYGGEWFEPDDECY